jgi:hypothetical protein
MVVGLRHLWGDPLMSEEWKRIVAELRNEISSALSTMESLSRDSVSSMGAEVAFELASRSISTALIALDEWSLSSRGTTA